MAHFDSTLDMAKTQVALRSLRYGHFPADIFDEYAWDMMLHLYISRLRKQTLYIDNVVNLTSKNTIVGERWIKHLITESIVEVDGEQVCLSQSGFERMDRFHEHAMSLIKD